MVGHFRRRLGGRPFTDRLRAVDERLYHRLLRSKPIRTPDASAYWRVVEQYQVNALFCAPTAMRAIRKEDPEGELIRKHDLRCCVNYSWRGKSSIPAPMNGWSG